MTQRKQSPLDSGEEDSLRQELRNLPRVSAPWYLESDVLRRLRAGETVKTWIARPIPAFAVSLFGVAILGGAGYFLTIALLSGSPHPDENKAAPPVNATSPFSQPQPEETPKEIPRGGAPAVSGQSTNQARPDVSAPRAGGRAREVLRVPPSRDATAAESSSTTVLPASRPPAPGTGSRVDSVGTRDTASFRNERIPVVPLNPARRDTTH